MRASFLFKTLGSAATLALGTACGASTAPSGGNQNPTAPVTAITSLPRPLTASEIKVSSAANEFSFALFRTVNASQRDSNVFASPLSASMALGMTMNGATGATYEQMRQALAFGGASETEINDGYKSLIALLRGLDASVDFRIANSIWYRAGFPFNQSFIDVSRNTFDAEVRGLNFADPASVSSINSWVSTATNGKITSILDRIEPDQVMFLINAIYFKGSWRDRFDATKTRDESFRAIGGVQPVRMMHRSATMSYASTADYEVVDLPYGNSAFTMSVVLPREGKSVESVAASLQGSSWTTLMGQLRPALVDLALPRFKLEWQRTLNDDLKSLGMRDAFAQGGADFTRLSPRGRELFIQFVKQKTFVDVNEEGTEAAAVTSVGVSVTSAPQTVIVRVDRPFVVMIRERFSGTVLFMGKVVRMP
ncbi:MAG: serpin family protein [Gemmatimonadaceae bacterium]|nr:serpin family protein [Gemmatimonadaceae bacterium]